MRASVLERLISGNMALKPPMARYKQARKYPTVLYEDGTVVLTVSIGSWGSFAGSAQTPKKGA
jgi:hypothetical protein